MAFLGRRPINANVIQCMKQGGIHVWNILVNRGTINKIKSLLPNKPRGVPRSDDRKVLSGTIFCPQRGYRWSDIPPKYGPSKTLYNRLNAGLRLEFSSEYSKHSRRIKPTFKRFCWMPLMSKPTGLLQML